MLGHIRYILFNVSMTIIIHNPTFFKYYHKRDNEGKCHRVALSHIVK